MAQLRYDTESAAKWFGRDIRGITLGHNVPFFADIADAFFATLKREGLEFIPLEEAAADPLYSRAASVVSDKFLSYHQKLADVEGEPMPVIVPDFQDTFDRVVDMGGGERV